MHKVDIPQNVSTASWSGAAPLHCHADLDPRTTALIVVDLQNCFMVEEVASAYCRSRSRSCPPSTGWRPRCARPAARCCGSSNTVNDTPRTLVTMVRHDAAQSREGASGGSGTWRSARAAMSFIPTSMVKPEDETVLK